MVGIMLWSDVVPWGGEAPAEVGRCVSYAVDAIKTVSENDKASV